MFLDHFLLAFLNHNMLASIHANFHAFFQNTCVFKKVAGKKGIVATATVEVGIIISI